MYRLVIVKILIVTLFRDEKYLKVVSSSFLPTFENILRSFQVASVRFFYVFETSLKFRCIKWC